MVGKLTLFSFFKWVVFYCIARMDGLKYNPALKLMMWLLRRFTLISVVEFLIKIKTSVIKLAGVSGSLHTEVILLFRKIFCLNKSFA